ncbi:MAG: nucleotidyltransferase domain-containing protein [Magnetococcales bacterium]|nr:nucleotidyltransferase domain-containing protein [Magnetococcales bacterium]
MVPQIVADKLPKVAALCVQHRVQRLGLFGSASKKSLDSGFDDLDFLVVFKELSPVAHADAFFGLMADLGRLFGCPVDLVEEQTIQNPYFQDSLEENLVNIYDLLLSGSTS